MKRRIVSLQENRIFRFLVSGGTAVLANISCLLLLTEYFQDSGTRDCSEFFVFCEGDFL
jgi:putative flippase GtrA